MTRMLNNCEMCERHFGFELEQGLGREEKKRPRKLE